MEESHNYDDLPRDNDGDLCRLWGLPYCEGIPFPPRLTATAGPELVGQKGDGAQMISRCPGKSAWPELVGEKGEIAAARVEKENPGVHAIVMLEGSLGTLDFRCDRVRVMVNEHGIVVHPPHIA